MNIDNIKTSLTKIRDFLNLIEDELEKENDKLEKLGEYVCTENLYMKTGELAYRSGYIYDCVNVFYNGLDIVDEMDRNHIIPFDNEWINKFIKIKNV